MTARHLLFEHPGHEVVRILLKLERLFNEIAHYHAYRTPEALKDTLSRLITLYQCLETWSVLPHCCDLIEQQIEYLAQLDRVPSVDRTTLLNLITQLEAIKGPLTALKDETEWLKQSYFLRQVQYRQSTPVGDLSCDLPLLHYWQNQSPEISKVFIEEGRLEVEPIRQACAMILYLMRESSKPEKVQSTTGRWEQTIPHHRRCQLVRVMVPAHVPAYPQIHQIGKTLSLQFYEAQFGRKGPTPYSQAVDFELTCCML